MVLRPLLPLAAAAVLLALSGCGALWDREEREAWRGAAETACLRSGQVQPSAYTRSSRPIRGPGICGVERPFTVSALQDGMVGLNPPAVLGCPATAEVNAWIADTIQPSAYAVFGQPVTELRVAASYSCRGRNGSSKGPLSEHAFANALDVSAFRLADGRVITVEQGWRQPAEGAFLRAVHQGACRRFSTVLGPDGDRHHQDHLHVDLARHNKAGTYRVCQ